jgi:hypothetical protein
MKINHFYAADDFTGEQCVLLSDHIASHVYDEAKELDECRSQWEKNPNCLFSYMWIGWKACAKSRARSAE